MPKNYCIMQIWAESGKSALPICNYSQILYQFLTFTQNLKLSQLLVEAYHLGRQIDLVRGNPPELKCFLSSPSGSESEITLGIK